MGLNFSVFINIATKALVNERKIPFEIVSPEPNITREKAMEAFISLREQASKNNLQDLTLDEINHEIKLARESSKEA